MQDFIALLGDNIALIATIAISVSILSFFHWFLLKRNLGIGAEKKLPRQILLLGLTLVAILSIILTLPISETSKGQLLSLIGLLFTGIIALSSTTFVTNAMAGLMLRLVNTFCPGDYIRINDQLCRVTERGLFHTEVQNEDKDLITYPNLYLVTNPVTVISHNGTVISCSLSLGYDVSREAVEKNLIIAAEKIGLETPFVLVKSLGDFSITYKVSGFLNDVKHLVSWGSNLHKSVLDQMHKEGIEIVSPNFMNTRQFDAKKAFVPEKVKTKSGSNLTKIDHKVEEKLFNKAEVAGEKENLQKELVELTETAKKAGDKVQKKILSTAIEELESTISAIDIDDISDEKVAENIDKKS